MLLPFFEKQRKHADEQNRSQKKQKNSRRNNRELNNNEIYDTTEQAVHCNTVRQRPVDRDGK
jgi:predicted acetyltransferase